FCSASSSNSTALPSLAGAPDARSKARSPTCASASELDAAGGCKGTIRLSQTSIRLTQTSGVGHRSHRRLSFGLVAGARGDSGGDNNEDRPLLFAGRLVRAVAHGRRTGHGAG